MYRGFMNQQSMGFVSCALPHLLAETGIGDDPLNFWVCYGSFVLNQQTPQSDLDLLLVHQIPSSPIRVQARYKDHPVTIYSLPQREFMADGNQRRYGGYFSGKLLNPFVVLSGSQESSNISNKVMGGFIGEFAATIAKEHGRKIGNRSNIVADCVLAYLRLCPHYKAYFLRYYISQNFEAIWQHMKIVIPEALVQAAIMKKISENKFEYLSVLSPEEFHLQLMTSVARFWSFGSCCHGCNANFPDFYFQKAIGYIESAGLEERCLEMLIFLEQKAEDKDETQ